MPNVPIPLPKPPHDIRPCSSNRWGAGTDIFASNLRLRPVSLARDGADGCFVVTGEVDASNLEVALRLHHVDATGTVVTSAALDMSGGVWFHEAHVVRSAPGSCIVVWSNGSWGARLQAQRFDSSCTPLWAGVVDLSPASHGFASIAAASDGSNGAAVAFLENSSDVTATQSFRLQLIDANGNLPWGTTGTVLAAPGSGVPFPVDQTEVVATGNDFLVLWEEFFLGISGPIKVHAAWVDGTGQIVQGPFLAGGTMEIWELGKHTAVADSGTGAVYVALVQSSELHVLRFENQADLPAWTAKAPMPVLAQAYSLAEDGNGGAFVAVVGSTGSVGINRLDNTGFDTWAGTPAATAAMINFGLPLGAPVPFPWGSVACVSAKPNGGAILVFPDWDASNVSHLKSQCFDDLGRPLGAARLLSSAQGGQRWPRITDRIDTASASMQPQPGSAFLPGTVVCVYEGPSGVSGSSINAQKLGCCASTRFTIPHLPDWSQPKWPKVYPGFAFVSFTSSTASERYGVVPLPDLVDVPGVNAPGCLLTPGVAAPGWVRIWCTGVPNHVSVDLWTHAGELVASAETETAASQEKDATTRTLTFRPDAALSYLLRFRTRQRSDQLGALPVGLRFESGAGTAPPSRTRAVHLGESAKTASARKATSAKGRKTRDA
jgi:hypothetical protein